MEKSVTKRVLIVDDEAEVRKLISDYLKRKRFEVYEAHNGARALSVIEKTKPDLIILDVVMPVMDGFQTLERLKNEPKYLQIPVIMLTVKSQPQNLDIGISLEADFYLPKPFKLNNLMKFINLLLKEE